MLVKGTRVLVREEGQRLAVENLMISDLVFDPFADNYFEIVDILARSVILDPPPHGQTKHKLQPVRLRRDALGQGRPSNTILVSPSQGILTVSKDDKGDIPSTQLVTASSISDSATSSGRSSVTKCKYFALFTEKPQYLDVSGLLLTTYSNDVYKTAQGAV